LIKQGATPVTEADDIVAVLQPIMGVAVREPDEESGPANQGADPEPDERARILSLLRPVSIDDLIRLSQTPPRAVRMVLLELEIGGRIERHGGGLVSLV